MKALYAFRMSNNKREIIKKKICMFLYVPKTSNAVDSFDLNDDPKISNWWNKLYIWKKGYLLSKKKEENMQHLHYKNNWCCRISL